MERSASLTLLGALTTTQIACSAIVDPDPSRLGGQEDAGTTADAYAPDAFVPEGTDAHFPDAFVEPPDAFVVPIDAYVPPGIDAFSPDAYAIPDAFSPDAFMRPDAACVERCEGGVFTSCASGSPVSSPCALGCSDLETRCRTMVPSNVETSLLSEGTMDLTLASTTINTNSCPRRVTQADGGEACLYVARNVTVPSSATVRVTGRLPLIIIASGTVTIEGVIDLSAEGATAGAGGYLGAPASDGTALGPLTGENGSFSGMWLDSGGGGGGHCGSGGGGGGAGTVAGSSGGAGTMSTLQPLTGGSGGGFGQGGGHSMPMDYGLGGAGGGAIQISAAVAIRVTGRIDVGGGAGQGGRGTINWGAGGGGGAGGGILLEAPTLTFAGSAALLATGGGGGAGQNGTSRPAGENGRTLDRPAVGGRPSGSGTRSADGGNSGGGGTADGLDGETNTTSDGNGGGGGGGIGCIVLRATMPPALAGRMSPSADGLQSLPLMTR